jgi:transglutaminase-like putative cysteine protease
VQIEALDSRSGFAALSDNEGNFVLPDELWYPGATFELVITDGTSVGRLIEVTAPRELPESGEFNIGELDLNHGARIELEPLIGFNSITLDDFDTRNREYYKELFDKLTAGKESDEERIDALNNYVAARLNYAETQWELGSPRRVLERGSQYCGHLAIAMHTLLAAGGYTARVVHMIDVKRPPGAHAVVEVFYGGGWHLYDPTFGLKFRKKDGSVASYKDVRLDTSLISEDLLARFTEKVRRELMMLLPAVYDTGYHHYFYFQGEQWNASKAQHSS